LSNGCSFLNRNGCSVARARQVLTCPVGRITSRTRSSLVNALLRSRARPSPVRTAAPSAPPPGHRLYVTADNSRQALALVIIDLTHRGTAIAADAVIASRAWDSLLPMGAPPFLRPGPLARSGCGAEGSDPFNLGPRLRSWRHGGSNLRLDTACGSPGRGACTHGFADAASHAGICAGREGTWRRLSGGRLSPPHLGQCLRARAVVFEPSGRDAGRWGRGRQPRSC